MANRKRLNTNTKANSRTRPKTQAKTTRKKTQASKRRQQDSSKSDGVILDTQQVNKWYLDLISLALFIVAVVFLLSLATYNSGDLPSWVWFSSQSPPNDPAQNFCGVSGAFLAGFSYCFFGVASYLIPACMLWVCVSLVFWDVPLKRSAFFGFAVMLVSASSFFSIQDFFLINISSNYNIISSGGLVGSIIGEQILQNIFGSGFAMSLLCFLYFCGISIMIGYHPVNLFILIIQSLINLPIILFKQIFSGRQTATAPDYGNSRFAERGGFLNLSAIFKTLFSKILPQPANGEIGGIVDSIGSEEDEPKQTFFKKKLMPRSKEPKIIDSASNKISGRGLEKFSLRNLKPKPKSYTDANFPNYDLPEMNLLDDEVYGARKPADRKALIATQQVIIDTLSTFNIDVTPGDITKGPTITRFEIYPPRGLRVKKIIAYEADIARATKATRINILAPIPGKDTIGIEIANDNRVFVHIREIFADGKFHSPKNNIPIALGKDVYGNAIIGDLSKMPHLLVAGATGSGKSVCINSIIASLLYRFSPDEMRFIMIDPKVVELQIYNSLPHLVVPVVTNPKKVLIALRWVINEMERRYQIFAQVGSRNFDTFNSRKVKKKRTKQETEEDGEILNFNSAEAPSEEVIISPKIDEIAYLRSEANPTAPNNEDEENEPSSFSFSSRSGNLRQKKLYSDSQISEDEIPDSLPYIVVIIDELADLMQTAPADVELAIARITQKARAAGIHMIVATQTPRSEVVTGVIKANIPSRIAFQVSTAIDSRVILDCNGAERLVGQGDLLYLPPGASQLIRSQGALISDEEIQRLVKFCSSQGEPIFEENIKESLENDANQDSDVSEEDQELLEKCLEVIRQEKKASTSMLQRRLRIGYTRAARMMDIMEERGIVAPGDGAKPREILMEM